MQQRKRSSLQWLHQVRDALVATAGEGIWVIDADSRTVFVNPRMAELLGYRPEEMLGRPMHQFVAEGDRFAANARLGDRKQGKSAMHESRLLCKDGSELWTLMAANPLYDEQHRYVGALAMVTDISERKKAAEEIRQYASLLKATLESTADGLIVVDRNRRVVEYNKRFLELWRIPDSMIQGRDDKRLLEWAARQLTDPTSFLQKVQSLYEHPEAESEDVLEFRDGRVFERLSRPQLIGGRYVGRVWSFRDVTDRVQTQNALQNTERTFRVLFSSNPIPMWVYDRNTYYFLEVNDAAIHHYGYSREEFLRMRITDIRPASEVPKLLETLKNQPANLIPAPRSTVRKHLRKDGSLIDVEIDSHPVEFEGMQAALVLSRDVTQEKNFEKERDSALKRFEVIAETSRALSATLDYQSTLARLARIFVPRMSDSCTVYDSSLRPLTTANIDAEQERLQTQIHKKYPLDPDSPLGVAKALRTGLPEVIPDYTPEVLAAASTSAQHLKLLRKLRVKSLACIPLVARSRTLGVVVLGWTRRSSQAIYDDLPLFQEISRRAATSLDNALLFEEAQESIAARDRLIAIASHELRTPLTPVTMQFQIMEQLISRGELSRLPPEKLANLMAISKRELSHLTELVENLLDYSHIAAGMLTLHKEEFDLMDLLQDQLAEIQPRVAAAKCSLERVDLPHVRGRWDRKRIAQVLLKLLTNAMKFGAGKPIRVTLKTGRGHVQLSIKDHGIGLSKEAQERVFRPFQREVSERHFGGMGLGLYVAKTIVEKHGGTIRVESKEGAGAKFVVELPLS